MPSAAARTERVGILLFNLGGPENLDQVRPFLYGIFSDPDIIRLPVPFIQKPLAWLIARERSKKTRGYYELIGGGSPLRRITEEQGEALKSALTARGIESKVYVGMRYWNPLIDDALAEITRDRISRLVVLPLYPQYSVSTTGSSLARMKAVMQEQNINGLGLSIIHDYHDDPAYIAALAESIKTALSAFPDQDAGATCILFSAHGVPVSYIEKGDCYLDQTRRTVDLVMERIGSDRPFKLSFQSRVGPAKWLSPSTDAAVRDLAAAGVRQTLLVPVSFVSEHIETLYELDILYKGVARECGIPDYRRVPALNCDPAFIGALASLVQRALQGQPVDFGAC